MNSLSEPVGQHGELSVYISPIVRQRRRQKVLFAALVALGLVVCLLPAPANQDATATASVPPVPVAKKQGFS